MKLVSLIGWATILIPIALIISKVIGWIGWSWWIVLIVAIGIPVLVCSAVLALVVWIIKHQFSEEWEHQ